MAPAYRGDTFRAMAVRRILTLILLCAVTSVQASPRTDPTTGRAVFTGATMPHATAIGLDPAALGLGELDEFYVAITDVIGQIHVDLDRLAQGDLQSPGARVRDVELSPGAMLAFIYHLAGDRATLGFEARTNPPESFPSDRNALRYHTLGGGERDWLLSVGASFKATNELFFGASLSHQNTFLRLRYARDTALESGLTPGATGRGIGGDCGAGGPCTLEDPRATELYDVDVRSPVLAASNLRVNIGVVYELVRDIWIGVAYHTPPGFAVQTELAGHVDVLRAPRDVARDRGENPVLHGQSVVEIQLPASVDAELRARLPIQLDLHVGGRWEDLSRLQAYDVRTYGSTLPSHGIPEWTERPRGMHDAFALWAGVEQVDTGQPWLGGARLGVETSSVSATRTSPLTIAPTSLTLDLGGQRRIGRNLIVQLSYGLQYFPTVSARPSAFDPGDQVGCIDSGYDYTKPACRAVREGYALPSAAGDYERIEHALRIGLRYELH
jgi:hypothetical protein